MKVFHVHKFVFLLFFLINLNIQKDMDDFFFMSANMGRGRAEKKKK